jgi:hypothetical protein
VSEDSTTAAPDAGHGPVVRLSGSLADERAGWLPVAEGEAAGLVAAFMAARAVARLVAWSGHAAGLRRWLADWRLVLAPGVNGDGRPLLRLQRRPRRRPAK